MFWPSDNWVSYKQLVIKDTFDLILILISLGTVATSVKGLIYSGPCK